LAGHAIEAQGVPHAAIPLRKPRRAGCVAHGWALPMSTRRGKRVKSGLRRRNPVARTLRDPTFRARREANRRRYSRKLKHREAREGDDA
jgi:hypothetical protein